MEENKLEVEVFPFQRNIYVNGHIKELGLTIGQFRIICSFAIVGKKFNTI